MVRKMFNKKKNKHIKKNLNKNRKNSKHFKKYKRMTKNQKNRRKVKCQHGQKQKNK